MQAAGTAAVSRLYGAPPGGFRAGQSQIGQYARIKNEEGPDRHRPAEARDHKETSDTSSAMPVTEKAKKKEDARDHTERV
jgi:hypothetical protein